MTHGYEEDYTNQTGTARITLLKSHMGMERTLWICQPILYKHSVWLFAPIPPQLALFVLPVQQPPPSEVTCFALALQGYSWPPTCHQQSRRTPAQSKGCSLAQQPPATILPKDTGKH